MLTTIKKFWPKTTWQWAAAITGLLFIFIIGTNFLLAWYFSAFTYPNTKVGNRAVDITAIDQDWNEAKVKLLPKRILLQAADVHREFTPKQLTVQLDSELISRHLNSFSSWLPLWELWQPHVAPLAMKLTGQPDTALTEMAKKVERQPVDAALEHSEGEFTLKPAQAGQHLDVASAKAALQSALQKGQTTIVLPIETLPAKITADSLEEALATAQSQQTTAITYTYRDKSKVITDKEKHDWFAVRQNQPQINSAEVSTTIVGTGKEFGISVGNVAAATAKTVSAIQSGQPATIELTAVTIGRTFRYCVAVKGVDSSLLSALGDKVNQALNDPRGWSAGGRVTFTQATAGCNFTVWLVAAPFMTSFGGGCDTTWSCTVKPNVLINYDRWLNGTATFNATGMSIEDYRIMAVNHEVGHQLGFGHVGCPATGQPAPIMMQQSVYLGGCTFNIWPTAGEQAALRTRLGI